MTALFRSHSIQEYWPFDQMVAVLKAMHPGIYSTRGP